MSDRIKVLDESARADKTNHALRVIGGTRDADMVSDSVCKTLSDRTNLPAMFTALRSRNEDIATSALAAICAQHWCGAQFDVQQLDALEVEAERLFQPVVLQLPCRQKLALRLLLLRQLNDWYDDARFALSTSSFLRSLTHFHTGGDLLHQAAKGELSVTAAWSRIEKMGKDAALWSAVQQFVILPIVATEERGSFALACAETMIRLGYPEPVVMSILGSTVLGFPDSADALLALVEMKEQSVALSMLMKLCAERPDLKNCDTVQEWTCETEWKRLLDRLSAPVRSSEEALLLVRLIALNHLVGRDVRDATKRALKLHPTNRGVAKSDWRDEAIAHEIGVLAAHNDLEMVPTKLGWAS